jgi:ABC-type transport system involved in Fe-S cluster assembly fused permease/ATPase subunit
MNALDNERESRATDVLLGYETVKYFCNEGFELAQYDKATRQYQVRRADDDDLALLLPCV